MKIKHAKRPSPGKLRQSSIGLAELGFRLLVQDLPEAKPKKRDGLQLSDADLKKQLKLW